MQSDKIIQILKLYCTKQSNINLILKLLLDLNINEVLMKKLLYNTIGIINQNGIQKAYNYIIQYIETSDAFNCDNYAKIKKLKEEEEDFIKNPPLVVEGINKCYKCGSNKTISYSKQTRSADEGTTVFCCCYICNNKWKM